MTRLIVLLQGGSHAIANLMTSGEAENIIESWTKRIFNDGAILKIRSLDGTSLAVLSDNVIGMYSTIIPNP